MHKNNFDFLRLLFSLFVIITHSYVLSGGKGDFLYNFTSNQLLLSDIGLAGFFSISGFLIIQSLFKSKSVIDYLKKRIYRILPGFIVAIIVCVIVGCMVSKSDVRSYFLSSDPWKYLYQKLLLFTELHHSIKGVFESNPYPRIVNASIWTIPYEFLFYLLLIPLIFLKNKPLLITSLLIFFVVTLIVINFHLPGYRIPQTIIIYFLIPFKSLKLTYFLHFALYFIIGSLLGISKKLIYQYKRYLFISCIVLIPMSLYLLLNVYTQYFLLPIAIISFGMMETKYLSEIRKKFGDLSYGTYLYAFLIQQTLLNFFPLKHWQLTLLTIPIALLFGFLSWNLVEKRFLSLKKTLISNNVSEQLS
jgi:peptidoglycan/LPS O-acetylase OafA/YrhL